MLSALADLFGNANGQTPLVLLVAGAAFIAAGWIGGRAFRSMQRQGRRLGAVEQLLRSERIRRRQLEQTLRERGLRLSYWPDDPPELYAVQFHQADDEDQAGDVDQADELATAHLQTQYFVPPRPTLRRTP